MMIPMEGVTELVGLCVYIEHGLACIYVRASTLFKQKCLATLHSYGQRDLIISLLARYDAWLIRNDSFKAQQRSEKARFCIQASYLML